MEGLSAGRARIPPVTRWRDPIDPAEDQRFPTQLELIQPIQAGPYPDVSLGDGLKGAASFAEGSAQHPEGVGAHGLQLLVGVVDVGLLSRQIRVGHTGEHRLWATAAARRKPPAPAEGEHVDCATVRRHDEISTLTGARSSDSPDMAPPAPTLRLDHRPAPLHDWLGGLWRYRGVLVALARKDFKVRYKRASLGVLWSVVMPLLQSIVLVFVFSRVGHLGKGTGYSYAGFVLAGMVAWNYVSTSVSAATVSIVGGSGLIDKVWFPRAILALVAPCAEIVTMTTTAVILLVELPIVGAPLTPRLLLLLPAAVLTVAFSASLGLVLAAMYVYFRDVKFMVQAVMMVWLYVTPIVYPLSALGGAGRWLDFNPLTGIVGLFQRAAVNAPVPSDRAVVVSVTTTVLLAIVAGIVHRHHDRLFVDLP